MDSDPRRSSCIASTDSSPRCTLANDASHRWQQGASDRLPRRSPDKRQRTIAIVALGAAAAATGYGFAAFRALFTYEMWRWLEGVVSSVFEVMCSGYVSVYLERMFKNLDANASNVDLNKLDIWDRNFQLAVASLPVYVVLHFVEVSYSYTVYCVAL